MSHKLVTLIINELSTLNYAPVNEKRIKIHCPFHNDGNPSLNIALEHPKYAPGTFKCFSCKAKGGWNKLAEKLHLRRWDEGEIKNHYDASKTEYVEEDAFRDLMMSVNRLHTVEQTHRLEGTEDFPEDFQWRGIPRDFWVKLGCRYYWDRKKDLFQIYMPVTMFGEYLGYTVATIDPPPNTPKYMTFAPTDRAILCYDSLPTNSTILLVEGHFDTWRMKYHGFNAGGMIGTENWSEKKTSAVLALMPKRILICTDGDGPGYGAGEMLSQIFHGKGIDTIFYKLPEFPKPNALDPGNMPIEYIEDLRRYVI